jgi:DNA-binding Lrp family transcriptional regulator
MRTQKSADARSRSPRLIPDIQDRILTALETYQWQPKSSILHFAISLGYSETHIRINLNKLARLGLIERFEAGIGRNKSINYRLKK